METLELKNVTTIKNFNIWFNTKRKDYRIKAQKEKRKDNRVMFIRDIKDIVKRSNT